MANKKSRPTDLTIKNKIKNLFPAGKKVRQGIKEGMKKSKRRGKR
jgi:hypothetical protein